VAALSLGVLLLTAPGCAQMPVAQSQPVSLSKIQKGVTSRDELMNQFGAPIVCRVTPDGKMTLSWHYSDANSPNSSILVVYFNRNQTVSDYLLLTQKSAAMDGMAGED